MPELGIVIVLIIMLVLDRARALARMCTPPRDFSSGSLNCGRFLPYAAMCNSELALQHHCLRRMPQSRLLKLAPRFLGRELCSDLPSPQRPQLF
ncbi:MAG: hypothetical protein ACKPKO_47175, partial [Candidatus Fonsibacter sp.]